MNDLSFRKTFQVLIIFILVLGAVLLSFSEVRAALSLLSGRTFDEAHDLGYIDWSGSVGYAGITHRDSICPSTCADTVSQISSGSQISGDFDRDVGSFDVLVAMVSGQGYGTATVTACGVTTSFNLNTGVGATPGYFKIFLFGIASTCRSWSVSASGGNVYLAAVDVTYAVPPILPPTISGSLPCTTPGANGWCASGLSLDLTASDPQGYGLTISGDLNGVAFPSCTAGPSASPLLCSVPINSEGSGTASFTATSTVLRSTSGSLVYKLDGTAPDLTGTVSGATGNPGWYISNVDLSFSATDAVSGVAKIEIQVNSGGWTDYTLPFTLSDGVYTVESRATDVAGNVSPVASQSFNIDKFTPIITSTLSGVLSSTNGNWYVSDVQVNSSVTDSGSGLASFQVNVDNAPTWTDLDYTLLTNLTTLTDGIHTIQFRARDQAGNSTTSPVQSIQIDQVQPSLSLPITGTAGLNGWYKSNTQVTVNASDPVAGSGQPGSGILSTEALQDGAAYAPYTAALSFTEGPHTYQAKVTDVAGNITETPLLNMNVDTIPPDVTLTPAITLGQAALYTLMDNGSQLGNLHAEITDSGGLFPPLIWDSALMGSAVVDQFVWDGKFGGGISAPPGTYQATLTITDVAGNEKVAVSNITINVLSFIQQIPAFHPPSSGGVYHPLIPTAIPPVVFGGVVSPPVAGSTPSVISAPPSGGIPITGVTASMQSWTQSSPSTTLPPLTTSTILWGAASAAAVGFFLIDAQKRKEEETKAVGGNQEALMGNANALYTQILPAYQALLKIFKKEDISGAGKALSDLNIGTQPPPIDLHSQLDKNLGIDEHTEKQLDAEADVMQGITEGIADVEIGRHALVLDPNEKIDLRHYNNKPDLESNLEKLDAKWTRAEGEAAQEIDKLITSVPKGESPAWWQELGVYIQSIKQKAEAAAQLTKNIFSGKINDYSVPKLTMPSALNLNEFMGGTGDLAAIAGSIAYLLTGNESYKHAADSGQILGTAGGIAQIVKYASAVEDALPAIVENLPKFGQGITLLGKISGVLSIFAGGYGMYSGYNTWSEASSEGNVQMQWVGGLDFASGLLATIGGIALFIPGAQPVAGVLLGLSALTTGASIVVENWPAISTAAKQSVNIAAILTGEGITRFGDFASNVTKTIGDTVGNALTNYGNFASNMTQTIGNTVGNALTNFGDFASNVTKTIGNAVGNALTNYGNFASNMTQTIGNTVGNALTNYGNFASNVTKTIGNAVGNGVSNVANSFANQIGNIAKTNSNPIVKTVTSTASTIVKNTGSAATTAIKNVTTAVSNVQKATGQAVGNAVKTVSTAVSNVQKTTGQAVGNAVKTVSTAVSNVQKATGQAVGNAVKTVSTAVSNVQKSTGQAVGNAVKTVSTAVSSVQKSVGQAIGNGLKSFAKWVAK